MTTVPSKHYTPPDGGLYVAHPRTAGDILFRTGLITIFSACAYGHLCLLLGWERLHGKRISPLLIVAFILLPELILLQLGFWAIPTLLVRGLATRRVAQLRELALDSKWISLHLAFTVFNALPLIATFFSYRDRLGVRYRAAIYVANLGLDHRNGWLAIGALVAVALSLFLLAVLVWKGNHSTADLEADSTRAVKEQQQSNEFDWTALTEVVYAALIHQILLAKTNHWVPLIAYYRSPWCPPIWQALIIWYVYKRRGVQRNTIIRGCSYILILATTIPQLITDLWELYDVNQGRVEAYNYRWKVKDLVSAKHGTD